MRSNSSRADAFGQQIRMASSLAALSSVSHRRRARSWSGGHALPGAGPGSAGLRQLDDLDEVAAGIVEHGRRDAAHLGGLLDESHALRPEPIDLSLDVVDGE